MGEREESMFGIDGIRRFHTWTHLCFGRLLDHLATLSQADYTREIPNFGFATLRAQAIHVLNCEGFWIHTLQGARYVDRNPDDYPTVDDARLLQQEIARQTLDYLSKLTDRQLNSNTEMRFPNGDVTVRTPALILHHVFTHAFHHKGQMAAMCTAIGHPATGTDLNHFE